MTGDACTKRCIFGLQFDDHVVFAGKAAEIDDGIAHTAEGGIDADIGSLGNLLEVEAAIVTHDNHAALLGGKLLDEFADVGIGLFAHNLFLNVVVVKLEGIDNVILRAVGDDRHLPYATEIVNDKVVSDTHNPMDELVLILVATRIDSVNNFVKSLLKDVVGDILVLDYREDVTIDFRLITRKQCFEARIITFFVT